MKRILGGLLFILVIDACAKGDGNVTDTTAPAAAPAGAAAGETDTSGVDSLPLEGFPDDVVSALDRRTKAILATAGAVADSSNLKAVQSVVNVSKTWLPGDRITVAFLGGSDDTRKAIVNAAQRWTQAANLQFDFWTDDSKTKFREWSRADAQYRSHIRIAFDTPGYWSVLGTDAVDASVRPPGQPSMSLSGFAQQLPIDWEATTVHEFGHALAFEHEHQNTFAQCDAEFRWEDDPGYVPTQRYQGGPFVPDASGRRPGLYTYLGGPPNNWSRKTIDFNVRQFAFATNRRQSAYDQLSIMKYSFAPLMYRNGVKSPCYTTPNRTLSQQDLRAAAEEYPGNPQPDGVERAIAADIKRGLDTSAVSTLSQAKLQQAIMAARSSQLKAAARIRR